MTIPPYQRSMSPEQRVIADAFVRGWKLYDGYLETGNFPTLSGNVHEGSGWDAAVAYWGGENEVTEFGEDSEENKENQAGVYVRVLTGDYRTELERAQDDARIAAFNAALKSL